MTALPPAQLSAPTAQVAPYSDAKRTFLADRGNYVVGVIAGKVVVSPRHAAQLGPDGSITIPVIDEFA